MTRKLQCFAIFARFCYRFCRFVDSQNAAVESMVSQSPLSSQQTQHSWHPYLVCRELGWLLISASSGIQWLPKFKKLIQISSLKDWSMTAKSTQDLHLNVVWSAPKTREQLGELRQRADQRLSTPALQERPRKANAKWCLCFAWQFQPACFYRRLWASVWCTKKRKVKPLRCRLRR